MKLEEWGGGVLTEVKQLFALYFQLMKGFLVPLNTALGGHKHHVHMFMPQVGMLTWSFCNIPVIYEFIQNTGCP
jgi:hypothetical protein